MALAGTACALIMRMHAHGRARRRRTVVLRSVRVTVTSRVRATVMVTSVRQTSRDVGVRVNCKSASTSQLVKSSLSRVRVHGELAIELENCQFRSSGSKEEFNRHGPGHGLTSVGVIMSVTERRISLGRGRGDENKFSIDGDSA